VLFNTLTYAVFLALVFVGAWCLVRRRLSLLLPWSALAGYVAAHPSLLGSGLVAVAFFFSVGAVKMASSTSNGAEVPSPARLAAFSLGISTLALTFLTRRDTGLDPFSYGLTLLGVAVRNIGIGTWLVFAVGLWSSYLLVVAQKVRLLFILIASYIFYAHWDYRFLPLIWGSSTADFWLARKIHASKDPSSKKLWLLGTVVLNLGVLGFFKYFNFGIDSASTLLNSLGVETPEVALRVALPVGISFFTFESMSYVIDVYRGEIEPQKSYAEYLSFVAFFPHLVAGPIVRPRDLLPQLAGPARFQVSDLSEGLFLIAVGLSKKIIIGDYLALNLVDRVFDAPLMYSSLEIYAGIVGYALQIYCDFSGYTDIAIGSALLLGIRFPRNFNSPYKAHNIIDFWRRWHISLSTWLRDYLYIPLGGNRLGKGRTLLNLLATMVLGGLWHGAAWTYVAWGFLHGAALGINKWWHERKQVLKQPDASVRSLHGVSVSHVLSVVFTFHLVSAGWVFFRAETFEKAQLIFAQLSVLSAHHDNVPASVALVLALGVGSHFVPERLFQRVRELCVVSPWPVQACLLTVVAIVLRKMASTESVPFVYFQF
jgi:alginate O-acetyltransferase complex protein AlgI